MKKVYYLLGLINVIAALIFLVGGDKESATLNGCTAILMFQFGGIDDLSSRH